MIQPRTTVLYHKATHRYATSSRLPAGARSAVTCAMCGDELPDRKGGRRFCPPCRDRRDAAGKARAAMDSRSNEFAGNGIATCHVCGRPAVEHRVSERCYA